MSSAVAALRRHLRPVKRALRPLKRVAERVRCGRWPLILMYHRIGAEGEDPWGITVSAGNFAKQLDALRRHRSIISLGELVARLDSGDVPKDCAVITFDDGYADNLHLAKPLLERFDAKATMFITTGALDRESEYYWDELGRVLLSPGSLPEALHLEIDGAAYDWSFGDDARYSAADAAKDRHWMVGAKLPTKRHVVYLDLWKKLFSMSEAARPPILESLRAWAGVAAGMRADRRFMTKSELQLLARDEIVEIGAHSVTHASLPAQAPPVLEHEILSSKSQLEEWLGRPITAFAYPYGEHNEAAMTVVRQAGFASACATWPGSVARNVNRFRLPRVQVCDWNGEEFTRRLSARFA